ncbi:hypothetical protein H0H93_014289 [Arthromyces matolae]|nr:hypothetical protein H0H93_014289 [Arthromyces matolae]
MNVSKSKNAHVQLLSCLVDAQDTDDSDYRFLVDGKHIKYVTTAPGTFQQFVGRDNFERTFGPVLLGELLPPFPVGNWNTGHVAKDSRTGEVAFVETEKMPFPGVENLWHPVKLSELDFTKKKSLRQHVHLATHPKLNDGKPVLIKMADWPWEIDAIENETTVYKSISDSDIGPKFLGHLIEGLEGRAVGIILEWVEGASIAGPGDLESCRKALQRLHELGMKHGDTNKHNFLVREGRDVVLIDFEAAKKCSPQELEDEMNALKGNLEDPGFRGGTGVICSN